MADRLSGKVAVVTGAGRGTGKAFALALAREGADVAVIINRHPEEGEAVAGHIRELGRKACFMQTDLRKVGEIETMVNEVAERFGKIDILVNNAGIFPVSSFLEKTEAEVDDVIGVNLRGLFFCSQLVARQMVKRGTRGSIINISSSQSIIGIPNGQSMYSATKGGVDALTRTVAAELRTHNIRVNSVAIGLTKTEGVGEMLPRSQWDEFERTVLSKAIMLGRFGTPEDYTGLIIWLASDESSYATGSTFLVDGGLANFGGAFQS